MIPIETVKLAYDKRVASYLEVGLYLDQAKRQTAKDLVARLVERGIDHADAVLKVHKVSGCKTCGCCNE